MLTPRQTNKGIPLNSHARGGSLQDAVGEIPPEWRSALDLKVLEQPVPYDSEIPELSDTILATRLEQHFTSESMLRQLTKPAGIFDLDETYTDKFKQIGDRTKRFRPITDLPLIAVPSPTRDVNTKNFGNYHFEETIEDSGTLFTDQLYEAEVPILIPEEFRFGFPVLAEEHLEVGIASPATFTPDDISFREHQENVFVKRVRHGFFDFSGLPKTLINYELTNDQQIMEQVRTIDIGVQTLTPTATTLEGSVKSLGNGMSVMEEGDVPDVFSKQVFSRERQILGAIPSEFRVGIETVTTSDEEAGIAIDVGALAGTVELHSETQTTEFKKKVEERSLDLSATGVHTDYKMTPDQQLESLIIELTDIAPTPSVFTAETVEEEIKTLGGGLYLNTKGTVPDVFGKETFSRERQILGAIPAEFRVGIQTVDTSLEEAGIAVDPGVLTGAVEAASEQQITEFRRKVTQRSLDFSLLDTFTNYKMTPEQQLESQTIQLTDIAPSPSVFTAETVESDIKTLGGGLWLVTEGTVPDVFSKQLYSKERQLLGALPAEFRVGIETVTTSDEEAGIAAPPGALGTGVEFLSEQQITEFRKKVEQRSLDFSGLGSLPGEEITEDFGGGILSVDRTVDDLSLSVAGGLLVTQGRSQAIGGGLYFRETKTREGTAWPILQGQQYDERLDVVLPFTQQVVTANTGIGTAKTDIEPIDEWREKKRTVDTSAIATVLDAYSLSYPSKINVDLPDILVSVTGIVESAIGEGASSEDGTYSATGQFSVSQSLRASAQSSANLAVDAQIVIKQFWGNNINSTHYHFFLPSPVTAAAVLAKINTLVGSVSAWPKYNPQLVNLSSVSKRASLQVVATSQGSLAASTSGSSSTAGGGTGYSRELGISLRTVRISPTIHPAITVGGTLSDLQTITAHADSEATGLGPFETIDQTQDVDCSLTPATIPATTGATVWPASGKFLYKVDAQPYRYGYVQIHAVVVDAADFPYN